MNSESTPADGTNITLPIEGDVARGRRHNSESGIPPQALAFILFILAAIVLTFMPMLMRMPPPAPPAATSPR